jgi:acetyl esterase/lipase
MAWQTTTDIQTNPAIGERGLIKITTPEACPELAKHGGGPFPWLLAIHGGGWQGGDLDSYNHFVPRWLPHGFGVVQCTYRLQDAAPFPAAFEDVAQVLQWLGEHGAGYGLDMSRCILFGASAGGHLSALLGLRATKEMAHIPTIRGIVDYCGIADLFLQYEFDAERGAAMTANFMRCSPGDNPALYEAASPVCHVHADAPPFFITHGSADPVVPIESSRDLAKRLQEVGIPVTLLEAPGRPHTMTAIEGATGDSVELLFEKELIAFMKRVTGIS